MENFDPMGVHTGDSIVVAPSQTLSDKEYQMLRSAALKIIRALGSRAAATSSSRSTRDSVRTYYVDRGQPARQPLARRWRPRRPATRSRASRPRSPSARRLDEIPNAVTGKTTAAFEPALDYCVVKIPRWPFDKFAVGDRTIGTQMKATGEVMAIDRSLRGGAAEGGPLARVRRPLSALGGRRPGQTTRELEPLIRAPDRRAPLGGDGRAAPRRHDDRKIARLDRHRPLVPRQDRANIIAMERRLLTPSR